MKRFNEFAIALWAAAAVYFAAKVASLAFGELSATQLAGAAGQVQNRTFATALVQVLTSERALGMLTAALLGGAGLAALGAIIEFLDRVCWLLDRDRDLH